MDGRHRPGPLRECGRPTVIARLWSARSTPDNVPAYAAHLRTHVLPELNGIAGYAGSMLLERMLPDGMEILVITYWESIEAIQAFAGSDADTAVVADAAAAILTGFDDRVRHYDVTVQDGQWIRARHGQG